MEFYFVKINKTVCLYTEKHASVAPKEFCGQKTYPYKYELRHGDDDWETPICIENAVFVNFAGTLFSEDQIKLDIEIACGYFYADVVSFEYLHAEQEVA